MAWASSSVPFTMTCFGLQPSGPRNSAAGLRVWRAGFRVEDAGFREQGHWSRVWGEVRSVWGVKCMVEAVGLRV